MDFVGVGIGIIFGFLAFAIREMPTPIAWGGIAVGCVVAIWKHIPANPKYIGPMILGAAAVVIGTAAIAWAVSASKRPDQPQHFENSKGSQEQRSVIKVDKGANVEGAKITNSKLHGFSSLAHVSGTMKEFSADNVEMNADGKGDSTINGESGYFGPPRTWIIPERLWTFALEPVKNNDGTFTVVECVAIRGELPSKSMTIKIVGGGIISASITRYQSPTVLDSAPAKNGKVILTVSPPESYYTYGLHILRSQKNGETKTVFEFP